MAPTRFRNLAPLPVLLALAIAFAIPLYAQDQPADTQTPLQRVDAPKQYQVDPNAPIPPKQPPAEKPAPEVAEFRAAVAAIPADVAEKMKRASWRPGCPVPLSDLRRVTVSHWDYAGTAQTGELIVHRSVAHAAVGVFAELFAAEFPIASLKPAYAFGGDDAASMRANNSSAFNCRRVQGGRGYSKHAYGVAIDINPLQNPYVKGQTILPPEGAPFVTRTPGVKGQIHRDGPAVTAFRRWGWMWGGGWKSRQDYQHFETRTP